MIADRVKELSTSTGTGAITLAGAVNGFESFNVAFGIGPSFDYCIESVDGATGMPVGAWEIGTGHLSGATTLVRDTVQQSSNADALVVFGAGTKNVFCTLSAAAINAKVNDTGDTMTGALNISNTTASTSSTTGALTVAGGVGVAGSIYGGAVVCTVNPFGAFGALQAAGGTGFRWTLSNDATFILQKTTDGFGAGTTSPLYVGLGVVIGPSVATGGDKGFGTLNATAVYDDNVLLTCFGTQYAARGTVDLAQWDAVSPTGTNKLAHKFVDMLKGFDPRDPRQYIARMLADEALPGMPTVDEWRHGEASLGEMHNRLWLATELLASAFVGLHNEYETRLGVLMQRVGALEKGKV